MPRSDKKRAPAPGLRAPEPQRAKKFPNLKIDMPRFDETTEAETLARAAQESVKKAETFETRSSSEVEPTRTIGTTPTVSPKPTVAREPTVGTTPTVSMTEVQPLEKPTVGSLPRVGEAPAVRIVVEPKKGQLRIPNSIVFNLLPQLEIAERAVYLELYAWTHGFGEPERRLSIAKLCKSLRIDYKRFVRIVTELMSKGLVEMSERVIGGPRDDRGTVFRVNEPIVIGATGMAPTVGREPTVGSTPIMKTQKEKHVEKAPVAVAPAPRSLRSEEEQKRLAEQVAREIRKNNPTASDDELRVMLMDWAAGEGVDPRFVEAIGS
jgi:hypothetical protein